MNSVVIDTNVFILLIVGLINPSDIEKHKRLSIYKAEHFDLLVSMLSKYDTILTCPNVITEIDNLLNKTSGENRNKYLAVIKKIILDSEERYKKSKDACSDWMFNEIGLTDTIVLSLAKEAQLLISGDSQLCDYARSLEIKLFDFKEFINAENFA